MTSIVLNVALFFAILVLVNVPAGLLGLEFEDDGARRLPYAPPGFVIPIVWFVLFALYGGARHLLTRRGETESLWLLYALAVLCASYAYYTIGLAQWTGLSALWFGLWGNLVVIAFAGVTAYRLYQAVPLAGYLVLPTVVWTAYATLIVLGEMRLAKLV